MINWKCQGAVGGWRVIARRGARQGSGTAQSAAAGPRSPRRSGTRLGFHRPARSAVLVPFIWFCIFPDTAPLSDPSAAVGGPGARRAAGALGSRLSWLRTPSGQRGGTRSGAQRTGPAVAVLSPEPASFLGPGHTSTTGGAGSCSGGGTREPGMGVKWAAFGTKCSLKWL